MKDVSRLERLDHLESWLKSDDTLVLGDAAAELGVSLRTIHRDIEVLRERGIPIESDRGRGGGVRVSSGWGIGKISLTRFEAIDLLIGLAVSDAINIHLQMGHADTIRRKIVASFSRQDQRRITEMRKRIRIGAIASQAMLQSLEDTSQQVGDELKEAFALQRVLSMHYVNQQGQSTNRLFEPHFLMLNPPAWYAIGWDHLRQSARTFRTDRMKHIWVTEKTFVPGHWHDYAVAMDNNPTREA